MELDQSFGMATLGSADAGSLCMVSFHGETHLGIKTIVAGPRPETRLAVLTHPRDRAQPRLANLDTGEQIIVFSDAKLELSTHQNDFVFGLKQRAGYICKTVDGTFLLAQASSDDICFIDLKTGEYRIYPPEHPRMTFAKWRIIRQRIDREPELIYSFG